MGAVFFAACSTGGTGGDGGAEAGGEGGPSDGGNDAPSCGTKLCVQNNTSPMCPSCAPMGGDICSPPAAITCNYTNGCSGAQLQSRQCTCVLPDASGGTAYWTCQ